MDIILAIILIAIFVFIGVHYGLMIAENRRLKEEIGEDLEISPYTPTK